MPNKNLFLRQNNENSLIILEDISEKIISKLEELNRKLDILNAGGNHEKES